MSAQETEIEPVTEGMKPREVLHLAASEQEAEKADQGLPWATMCGIQSNGNMGVAIPSWALQPMEKCAVCASMAGDLG